MIIIAGSLSFPAAERDAVLAAVRDIVTLSRKDAGCVEYFWSHDLDDPDTFRFFECWETQADLDAHMAAPHEVAFSQDFLSKITGVTATNYVATLPPPTA